MNRVYSFQKAPRCSATSKRTRERCKAPAVRGWRVCRFHGARGGDPAVADLVAGHVPIISLGLSASAPQVQSGKLRALAVTGPQRVAEFSDVPTFRESGVDLGGLEDGAFGIVAPTGTPAAVIEKLNGAVNQVLMDPKTRSGFETKAFATVVGGTSEEFGTFLRTQQKFWREALEAGGVRPTDEKANVSGH
jgi:tripartite-type tricarboxylate transporter receptor subunit TctC